MKSSRMMRWAATGILMGIGRSAFATGYLPPPPTPIGFYMSISSQQVVAHWTSVGNNANMVLKTDGGSPLGAAESAGVIVLPNPIDLTQAHEFTLVASNLTGASQPAVYNYNPGPQPDPRCSTNDADVKAKVQTIRSALSVYYGDTEGSYPSELHQLVPKYLSAIPTVYFCDESLQVIHPDSDLVTNVSDIQTTDSGGWAYDNAGPTSMNWGAVVPNSAGKSPKGFLWISY